jgi:hypothetical protein
MLSPLLDACSECMKKTAIVDELSKLPLWLWCHWRQLKFKGIWNSYPSFVAPGGRQKLLERVFFVSYCFGLQLKRHHAIRRRRDDDALAVVLHLYNAIRA